MKLLFGTVPILWNNDDLPASRGGYVIPCDEVLDAIAKAGFSGTELGSNYPRDAGELGAALGARSLELSGAYFPADLASGPVTLPALDPLLGLLEGVGARFLIVALPLHPDRVACAGAPPPDRALPEPVWAAMAQALDDVGRRCRARGIRAVFHNHAGTWVETPGEVAKLMALTSPEQVGLCLDTGHWTVGGGDAAQAVRRWIGRLDYLHLKDVDPDVLRALRAEGFGFYEALDRRVFTELGKGCVDVRAIADTLRAADWPGWVVSEQDTSWLEPCEAAARNFAALERFFGAVPAPGVLRN